MIEAEISQAKGGRIVVFAEPIMANCWPDTRQQLAMAAPPGQLWILGADTGSSEAVVRVTQGHACVFRTKKASDSRQDGPWFHAMSVQCS